MLPVLLVLAATAAPAGVARGATLTRHPSVWLQAPTSITIAWQTDVSASGKVLYGVTPELGSEETGASSTTDHAVSLTGLNPGSLYFYRVVSGTDTLTDGSDTFRTAPATQEPFRFLAFGDLGRATSEQIQVAARIDSLNADFALLTGDIIYEAGEAANFTPQYFDIYRPTIARTPFYSCLGNHDVATLNGQPYLDAFHFPTNGTTGTERHYSFDYSNAHIACVEVTLENTPPNPAMIAWLDADLAATDKHWKFVFFHVPMYSNLGLHGDDPVIAASLGPIFDARGVDVVFQGHNHYYARSYPVRGGSVVAASQDPSYLNPGAPIYIVTGGAGRFLHALSTPASYEVYSKSTFHTTVIDVSGSTLQLKAVERDGTVFDSMTLTKDTPTAVTLSEFHSEPEALGVRLRWRVPEGSDAAAFHVYRGRRASAVTTRLTESPLTGGPEYDYLDATAEPGREYYYALGALDEDGGEERVGLIAGMRGGPYRFAAGLARPNPSDAETAISFTLDRASSVRVALCDVAGRVVRTLKLPGTPGPGPHEVRWDGKDRQGRRVPAGIYFARVQAGSRAVSTRFIQFR